MARLYANENFRYRLSMSFGGWVHDVLTTQDTGSSVCTGAINPLIWERQKSKESL